MQDFALATIYVAYFRGRRGSKVKLPQNRNLSVFVSTAEAGRDFAA